jgi:hypothetical protein
MTATPLSEKNRETRGAGGAVGADNTSVPNHHAACS